jgi:predicted transport protein
MNRDEMTQKIVSTIEKDTGKTLDFFVKAVKDAKLTKHKQILNYFKDEHGLSYGYANTMAHAVRDVIEGVKSEDTLVEEQYAGAKADLKPIYDTVIKAVEKFGKDVEIAPKKTYVSLRRKKQFAIVQPSTKTRMDIGLIIKGKDTTERLEAGNKWNAMCTHRVRVTEKGEVNSELVDWLKEAYEAAG